MTLLEMIKDRVLSEITLKGQKDNLQNMHDKISAMDDTGLSGVNRTDLAQRLGLVLHKLIKKEKKNK